MVIKAWSTESFSSCHSFSPSSYLQHIVYYPVSLELADWVWTVLVVNSIKRACSSSDTFKYGISDGFHAPLCSLTQLKLLTPLRYTRYFLSAFLLPFLFKYSLTDTTFSFGRAGVECYCQHDSGAAVIQLQFLINEVCPVLSLFVYPSSLLIFDWQASL